MSDNTTTKRCPLSLNLLYMRPITSQKKAELKSYSAVCTSKENCLSENTTKERHRSLVLLPSFCVCMCVCVKGPAANATDAPQPWGLLWNPVLKTITVFFVFQSNGAPVEWNWRRKTEVLREKPILVPLCPPQITHGLTRDRTRASDERPATNRLNHGTALCYRVSHTALRSYVTTRKKNQLIIRYERTSIFSYVTLTTVQNNLHPSVRTILRISKEIYSLSGNLIIPPHAVTGSTIRCNCTVGLSHSTVSWNIVMLVTI